MTIIVTQSNAANFPSVPSDATTGGATLPGVYEAWPPTAPWTIDLTLSGEEIDPLTGETITYEVTDHSIVADPNNLFEYAEVNYTKLAGNKLRVYGPALNVFRDAYYLFQLEHTAAIFGKDSSGKTIELDPIVLPNQNDPNVTIKDSEFVMPPRPKGEVEIVDTGVYGGIVTVSLPRYFTRKLRPNTTLPWISFVTYQPPSVSQITKSFTINCSVSKTTLGIGGLPGTTTTGTETITISQTIYFSWELVMQYISYISEQRRIE